MGVTLPIEALNSGELSPLLAGRGSKPFYQTGLKLSLNMIPTVQGPAVQRSGTYFIREVKDSTKRTALVRFEFNVTQAYILEVGDQYMRVYFSHGQAQLTPQNISGITNANPAVLTYVGADTYANGDRVYVSGVTGMVEVNNREFVVANVNAGANTFELQGVNSTAFGVYAAGGTVAEVYEIATPYLQADLFDADGTLRLKFAQTLDTLYIAHPSYATRKLSRTGHTAWTLTTAAFSKGPFAPINNDDTVRVFCTQTGATNQPGQSVSLQANSAIFDAGMAGELFYMEELYLSDNDVSPYPVDQNYAGASAAIGTQYSYQSNVYAIVKHTGTGVGGGTPPQHTAGDAWDFATGIGTRTNFRYLHSRWAIIQLTAFVDSKNMTGTIITYLCDGLTPQGNVITNVTNGGGLFRITSAGHGYGDGDYVKISGVTGTGGMTAAVNGDWKITNPQTNTFDLVGSAFVGAYTAGGTAKRYATWKWAHGAFSASKGYAGVVAFDRDRLWLAATTAQPDSAWASELGDYDSFAPKTGPDILATNAIAVTLANGEINKIEWMHPQVDGLVLGTATAEYTIVPATTTVALGPSNVDAPARSFYGSRGVQPAKVGTTGFFVQRQGRKLRDLGAKADTEGNSIGSDLTVRAQHLTKKYPIVDMAWVQEPDALLWCARSDGQLLSFTFQNEQEVFAWSPHLPGGTSVVVEDVASIPSPDGLSSELWLMVKRTIGGVTRRYIEYLTPRWIDGDAIANAFIVDAGLTYSGAPVTVLSGLYHLIGETVSILVDGKVHRPLVVDATGSITLDYAGSVISVGEPMFGRVQPMPLDPPTQTGSSQGKKKIIARVSARLAHSNNIRYGPDFTTMERQSFVTTESLYDTAVALQSGDLKVDWPGAWDEAANLCFENDLPVPFSIVALYPHVETVEA